MMASEIKFNKPLLHAAMRDLGRGMRTAGEKGMREVVKRAETDARQLALWRNPGRYTVDYPSGTWDWEVTGMAKASIQGYVVPNKDLARQATRWTTSYINGMARQHPHYTDDGVTGDHANDPSRVIGVVTMNIAYAPYLQEYEREEWGTPCVVEVFEMNWAPVYAPRVLAPVIEREMAKIAAKYT